MPAVDEALALLRDNSYMQDVVDLDMATLRDEAVLHVRDTDGSDDLAVLAGVSHVVRAFRNGHSSVFHTTAPCRDLGGADGGLTVWGVCAVPAGEDFVIASQPGAQNPLGLHPGDRIVARNGKTGAALVDALLDGPVCTNGAGHPDARVDQAAGVLFSRVRAGDVLDVVAVDGATRTIEIPDEEVALAECRFPAGPTAAPWIEAELRNDGVLVVRVRRFILFKGEPGFVNATTEAEAFELIDNMIEQAALAVAPHLGGALGIVWDARGNIGGASPVGFSIVAGMLGARHVPIARCTTRIAGTDPIQYQQGGPDYDIVEDDRIAVDLPAALLIDGLAISAADYFARAVRLATDARIFGRPTAGAYGGGGGGGTLADAPNLFVAVDPFRCNDVDGAPLETVPTFPDERVDQRPEDLAVGRDTVLEAAATHLLSL
jgi:hypothetical protein